MKFAMKLAFLNQLFRANLLSDPEYAIVKNDLMNHLKVPGVISKSSAR